MVLVQPEVANVTAEAASTSPASPTRVPAVALEPWSEPATVAAAAPPFARAVGADFFLAAADDPEERLLAGALAPPVPLAPAAGFDDESYLSSLPAEVTLAAWMALILAIQLGWGCTLRTVRSSSEV